MAEAVINGKDALESLTVEIRFPRGYGFRMWLTWLIIRLAVRVSPIEIDASVREHQPSDASTWTRFEGYTAEGGKIVLSQWPEGYVLRHHGEIVWREWA